MLLLKIVFEQESKKIEKTNSSDVLSALFKNVHGQYFNTAIHGRYLKPYRCENEENNTIIHLYANSIPRP